MKAEREPGMSEMKLPEGWQAARIGELAKVVYGKSRPKADGPFPVIGSGGVYGYAAEPLIEFETLVIGRKGAAGAVVYCPHPCYPSDTTFYLDWKQDVSVLFLYYHLLFDGFTADKSVIPSLQRPDVENFLIPLPPLPEQQAIAETLRAVQQAREARRRELGLERERKAALMQHLFTHGTRGEPRRQTEIGELPQSWRVVKLGEIAEIARGKFAHRPRNAPEFYGGDIPFIQTGDVAAANGRIKTYSQTLNEKGLSISKMFPKGTIVITIAANIGFTGILEFDSAFPDSLIGITPREGVDTEYLNYYLTTQQSEMDRKAPRGTQKNINIEFLLPWPVVLPPLLEQRNIATVLCACDAKIAGLERELALLEELFRALLEELMTGRIRVKDEPPTGGR